MKIFKRGWLTLITVFLLTACCLAAPAYFIYMNARSLIVDEVGNNAIDIAVAAAAFIEKDIEKFEQLPAQSYPSSDDYDAQGDDSGDDYYYDDYDDDYYDDDYYGDDYYTYDDSDSGSGFADGNNRTIITPNTPVVEAQASETEEYFNDIMTLLERIGAETGAAAVYLEKKLSDTEKGYVFERSSPLRARLRTNALTEEEILAFNKGIKTSSDLLRDESIGEFIVGYAPILSAEADETVGIVVVEFALADAVALTSGVSGIIIASFVVIILLTTFVVYRLLKSRIKYLSKDVLTELCNKRYFEKHLKKVVRSAAFQKRALSLIMLDIDLFKNINDTLGHMAGDEVIKSVSNVLLKHTRRDDVCCRFGGDEFVLTLPGTDRTQAAKIAGRIREEVAALCFESASGPFGVTLSIGVAQWDSRMSADGFKEAADKAMYYSKNNGKNRITVYNSAFLGV